MAKKEITLTQQEWSWAMACAARIPVPPALEIRRVALNTHLANIVGDLDGASSDQPVTVPMLGWQRQMLATSLADERNGWLPSGLPKIWAMRRVLGDLTAPTMEMVQAMLDEEEDDE